MPTFRMRNRLLPVEAAAVMSAIVLAVLSVLFELRIYYPDHGTLWFIGYHYLGPLIPVLAIPSILLSRIKQSSPRSRLTLTETLRTTVAFCVVVFAHFNLKLWAQLINPLRFDTEYRQLDLALLPLTNAVDWLGDTFRDQMSFLPNAYHEIFVAMFFVSFLIHGALCCARTFHHLVGSVSLVLLLGGLSYAIAPAIGPFIFETAANPIATAIQMHMHDFYSKFISTQGDSYDPAHFVAALAAMPSLHVAHSLVFGYFAFRYTRFLGWIYVLPLVYLATDAVASKWHYLADIPAGAGVAAISIYLAGRMMNPVGGAQDVAPVRN